MPITQAALARAVDFGIYPDKLQILDDKFHYWIDEKYAASIAVGVMLNGQLIFEGRYGPQDPEKPGEPLRNDVIFPVASITKPVVAAMLMVLQERGDVDVADPYVTYLPEHKGHGRDEITIAQLLSHTSGLSGDGQNKMHEYVKEQYGLDHPKDEAPEEEWDEYLLKVRKAMGLPDIEDKQKAVDDTWETLILKIPPPNAPGKVMAYCSYGYGIALDIVKRITGLSAEECGRTLLWDKLGMEDTHFTLPESKYDRVVRRPEGCEGYPWQNKEGCFKADHGGGGMKTTICDILKFLEMIRTDGMHCGQRILSWRTVRAMKSNYNAHLPNPFDAWTLGFNYRGGKVDDLSVLRGVNCLDHGGWGGSKVVIDAESGLSMALFTSHVDGKPNVFGRTLNILLSSLK